MQSELNPVLPDIKPQSPMTKLNRDEFDLCQELFPMELVAPAVGLSVSFIKKVIGKSRHLTARQVLELLDLDEFSETFIRRSQVLDYLQKSLAIPANKTPEPAIESCDLRMGSVLDLIGGLEIASIQCVVTSSPYWAMRIYEKSEFVLWADGEFCPYGHEQTPEGFIRHSVEILYRLLPSLKDDASVWWNLMDTFNTRTQIRGNAAEALKAMQGKDQRSWAEHECRRYSAGHSFLKDGEQCHIPSQVAYRAARIGYYVKSTITWSKSSTLPEPQNSRVSRNLEYILHLTTTRTPKFRKEEFRDLPPTLGGRNPSTEQDKLCDVWTFGTSAGGNGHGAQFPLALPGRCIGLTTDPGDTVLDPFLGSGTTAVAAMKLGRKVIGFDVSAKYLNEARRKIQSAGLETA